MKKHIISAFLTLATAAAVGAQQPEHSARTPLDSLFARARQLVLEGNGAAGRALVDSLVNAALPGSPAQVDALFWRASLAGTASDAERDYRRIIVEYPLSQRAGDALFSLAQLEIVRGDRENAASHLQRFLLDHPESPERGRAALSLGRMLIEQGRMAKGCAVIGRARGSVSPDAVELRNQVDYYSQRCDGVDTVEVVAAQPPRTDNNTSAPRPDTTRRPSAPIRQAATAPAAATTPDSPRRDTTSPNASAAPRRDTVAPSAAPVVTATKPVPRDTATKKIVAPSPVTKPPQTPAPAASAAPQRYTVQVAAFDTKADADQLVERLKKRGLTARVFGTARPFRVRIGRYPTESAASDMLKGLRAQGMNGFVAPAEPEGR